MIIKLLVLTQQFCHYILGRITYLNRLPFKVADVNVHEGSVPKFVVILSLPFVWFSVVEDAPRKSICKTS